MPNQPDAYNEPGLFILKPDATVYGSVVGTMPFMRPPLTDVVETLRWVNEHDYPRAENSDAGRRPPPIPARWPLFHLP